MSHLSTSRPFHEQGEHTSPAREALQNTLDSHQTSKSWLGSVRSNIQKAVLSVKARVDSIRGEPQAAGQPPADSSSPATVKSRTSIETLRSPPPSKGLRPRTFSTKSAALSLRQHLPRTTPKNSTRGSMFGSIVRRDSCSEFSPSKGPEQLETEAEGERKPVFEHGRKLSLASVAGSLRSLGRARAGTNATRLQPRPQTPDVAPEEQPLPSSPIDIPAPVLPLNLPSDRISASFLGVPEAERKTELLKLTDPANITMGAPVSYYVKMPERMPTIQWRQRNIRRPGKGLQDDPVLDIDTFDDLAVPDLPTPMPGTNMALEVNPFDGHKSQVFERDVEPVDGADKSNTPRLRMERSIDALAQAAAERSSTPPGSPFDTLRHTRSPPAYQSPAHGNRQLSAVTTNTDISAECAELQLTRQLARPGHRINDHSVGSTTPARSTTPVEGFFSDWEPPTPIDCELIAPTDVDPPAPDKEISLPFRPKQPMEKIRCECDCGAADMLDCKTRPTASELVSSRGKLSPKARSPGIRIPRKRRSVQMPELKKSTSRLAVLQQHASAEKNQSEHSGLPSESAIDNKPPDGLPNYFNYSPKGQSRSMCFSYIASDNTLFDSQLDDSSSDSEPETAISALETQDLFYRDEDGGQGLSAESNPHPPPSQPMTNSRADHHIDWDSLRLKQDQAICRSRSSSEDRSSPALPPMGCLTGFTIRQAQRNKRYHALDGTEESEAHEVKLPAYSRATDAAEAASLPRHDSAIYFSPLAMESFEARVQMPIPEPPDDIILIRREELRPTESKKPISEYVMPSPLRKDVGLRSKHLAVEEIEETSKLHLSAGPRSQRERELFDEYYCATVRALGSKEDSLVPSML